MMLLKKISALILTFVLAWTVASHANPQACQGTFTTLTPAGYAKGDVLQLPPSVPRILFDRALPGARDIRSIQQFSLMEFNVLNLYLRHESFLAKDQNQDKPKLQLEGVARIIKKANPDMMVLVEVDNLKALQVFNRDYLGDQYRPLLLEGNDNRGIDIGMYIKKDMPIDIELRSKTYVKDDVSPNPIFSRDLPIYLLRPAGKETAQPIFAVLGTHYKSMRGGNSDPSGSDKRQRQALATAKIIRELQEEFGEKLPIILTGDFNNEVHNQNEFGSLYELGMEDALAFTGQSAKPTHAYFQPDGTPDPKQIDGILLNQAMQKSDAVLSAEVLSHLDENGQALEFPKSFAERETRPSDHVPSLLTLDFKKLFR